MKRALVTGSVGFIGSNFARYLTANGWGVTGCDLVNGDDALDLFRHEDMPRFDLVIHAAYRVGGRVAIDGVNDYFAQNLQLDAAMFRWALHTRQHHVVYLSSSAAYPVHLQSYVPRDNVNDLRLTEYDINLGVPDRPDSYYGLAKLTGEHLAKMSRASGLRVSVVRPFSGYGEDQSLDYPLPSIVRRALQGDLAVWGPRGQTRDWIHVSDVIGAIMAVVESQTEDPVNICSGIGVEMGEVMKMAIDLSRVTKTICPDAKKPVVKYDTSKPTGVLWRVGNPDRMLKYYTPKISLEQGISRMIDKFL